VKRSKPVVLVTGGNRGIGFEACRALAEGGATVLLGARKLSDGESRARELTKAGSVVAVPLDVADSKSVAALKVRIEKEFDADEGKGVLSVPEEVIEKTLSTNLLGAWSLCRAFAPGMADKRRGRIVNISSGMGALSSMGADAPSYRVSKAALNALTLVLAAELKPAGVSVVSFCPGWVATDMGGKNAPRTPESAGKALAIAALDDERTGVFIRDGQIIPW